MEVILCFAAIIVAGLILIIIERMLHVTISNRMVIRKANKFGTPDLCCCGSMLKDHSWGDNHPFVSEMEYFIDSNLRKFH